MKVAVIGTSKITRMFLDTVKKVEALEFYAAYSRDITKSQALCDEYGGQRAYDDLEKMLADGAVEIVYVASPNALHAHQMELALSYGKHVVGEKPFTSNYKEFEKVSELALQKGLFLFEAITTLYMPYHLEIKKLLPQIGEVTQVQIDYSRPSPRYFELKKGKISNILDPHFSGGCLMDMGVYCVHMAVDLFGLPQKVVCYANLWENGADTSGMILMKYPSHVCMLSAGKDSFSQNFCQFHGEEGYLTLEGGPWNCPGPLVLMKDGEKRNIHVEQGSLQMLYELKVFAQAIQDKDYAFMREKLIHSGNVLKVLDMARESAGIRFPADR